MGFAKKTPPPGVFSAKPLYQVFLWKLDTQSYPMRKKLKTQVYALEKGYNEITFALKRVRDHMGRMMTRIREFKSHLYATDK